MLNDFITSNQCLIEDFWLRICKSFNYQISFVEKRPWICKWADKWKFSHMHFQLIFHTGEGLGMGWGRQIRHNKSEGAMSLWSKKVVKFSFHRKNFFCVFKHNHSPTNQNTYQSWRGTLKRDFWLFWTVWQPYRDTRAYILDLASRNFAFRIKKLQFDWNDDKSCNFIFSLTFCSVGIQQVLQYCNFSHKGRIGKSQCNSCLW